MWLSSMCCMRSYRFLKHRPHLLNLHSFNRNTAIYPSGSEQRWIGPSSRWLLLLLLGGGRVLTVWLSADHYWREAAATTGRARGGGVLPGPPADRRHSPPPTDARAPQNRAAAAAASSWRLTRPCVCVCVTRWSKTGDLPEEDDRETETDLNFIAFVFFPTRFPTPKRRIYYYCYYSDDRCFSTYIGGHTAAVWPQPPARQWRGFSTIFSPLSSIRLQNDLPVLPAADRNPPWARPALASRFATVFFSQLSRSVP